VFILSSGRIGSIYDGGYSVPGGSILKKGVTMENHSGLIVEGRPVGPFAMNSYLIACAETKEAAVIDSGGEIEEILSRAHEEGFQITKLLQTHAHIDHVAGLSEAKSKTESPIYLHPADQVIYQNAPLMGKMFGLNISALPPVDELLSDGQVIALGECRLEVLHTPGHCPGHVCFVECERGVILGGDLIFKNSIGRVDLPGADPEEMVRSLRRVMKRWDDDMVIYPGHMSSTRVGSERKTNPFLTSILQ
jgi:glyoxylase-like metal-dependent hydrolase (beta-lactamase superfamily II)